MLKKYYTIFFTVQHSGGCPQLSNAPIVEELIVVIGMGMIVYVEKLIFVRNVTKKNIKCIKQRRDYVNSNP
ncbi:MAG: hypothetical protein KKF27_21210 [Gammaproteobacteria bacterium]|nr:hypothetical protein [Gammaproteobacteria bacterium]